MVDRSHLLPRPCRSCEGEGRFKTGWDCVACGGTGQSRVVFCMRFDHRDVMFALDLPYGCWKCDEELQEEEERGAYETEEDRKTG
jgi:RecJ-like exonuclease